MWREEDSDAGDAAAVSQDRAMAGGGFIKRDQTCWYVASDVPSDLVIQVGAVNFHVHKYPLVSRSARLNRLVFESSRPSAANSSETIQLNDIPGGPEAFELAARFCYGAAVDLTASNITVVRCAAEYLEMTEDLEEGNLIFKSEAFLSYVVLASWRDSVVALKSCEMLSPWAENLQIVRRCCESVAGKACADLAGGVVRRRMTRRMSTSGSPQWGNDFRSSRGSSPGAGGPPPPDWWLEDVALLRIDHFVRVVTAIKVKGMSTDLVGAAVAFYASKWLPGLSPEEELGGGGGVGMASGRPTHMVVASGAGTGSDVVGNLTALSSEAREQRTVVESLISIIPQQRDAVACEFLLRLLRLAVMLKVAPALVTELEKRVGMQLEQASLHDLLIPSYCRGCDTAYDVDLVLRLIEHFIVFQDQATEEFPDQDASGTGPSSSYRAKMATATATRVARLVDSYLTEVARDQNLSLTKFQMLAEALPASARECDDGLYRAVDSYLKAHPTLPEHDRKRLCRVMDCQKLSADACVHAAQNERLPLRVVVRIIFAEQVKISNAVATCVKKQDITHDDHPQRQELQQQSGGFYSYHPVIPSRKQLLEGTPLSFQEGWVAAKKDINTLKFEAETMKAKYLELQNDLETLQRHFEKMTSTTSLSDPTVAATPLKATGWGGWKKLVKLTRMSGIAEGDGTSTGASGDGGLPPVERPRKPRRWRNSVS